jgi:hypothetical protein
MMENKNQSDATKPRSGSGSGGALAVEALFAVTWRESTMMPRSGDSTGIRNSLFFKPHHRIDYNIYGSGDFILCGHSAGGESQRPFGPFDGHTHRFEHV